MYRLFCIAALVALLAYGTNSAQSATYVQAGRKLATTFADWPVMLASGLMLSLMLVAAMVTKVRNKPCLSLPHPQSLPVVGNALAIRKHGRSDQALTSWARQHGKIYSVQMFNMTWVILSGYEEIHEALVQKGQIFAGRHRFFRLSSMVFHNKNIVMSDPTLPQWQPMRKAMHRSIQPIGSNLNRVETVLIETASKLIEKIKSYRGAEVDLAEDIGTFVTKVAVAMIIGQSLDDDKDEALLADISRFERLVMEVTSPICGVELDVYPWLRHLGHPVWKKMKELVKLRDELFDIFWQTANATYKSPDQAPQCVMHAIAQTLDKQSKVYEPTMTHEHAIAFFSDALAASVFTTSNSAYALVNLLINNPTVFRQIQEETDAVVGRYRAPNINDRESMPYTVATIYELLRWHSPLPALLPHMALEDSTIGGQFIPKGTTVFALACALHHDAGFWGDPSVFRPDRFLDESGQILPSSHPNRKRVLSFGAGTRECVGEVFALRRLFIFITSIAQAFDLEAGDVTVSCDPADYVETIVLQQKPYKARLIERVVG